MNEDIVNQIVIKKMPSFREEWHEGFIEYNDHKHMFWLIHPIKINPDDNDYECEVRWWFKDVPREVRLMYSYIIESFKQTLHDNAPTKSDN
jgi:hypothetical protein